MTSLAYTNILLYLCTDLLIKSRHSNITKSQIIKLTIMTLQEKHQLNESFLENFPMESLENMTLDQYTNLNRSDSFCYWVENKTEPLGSVLGGSAFKFGIYRYNQKPKEEMTYCLYDENYAWYATLGSSAEEAFDNVKRIIIRLAEYGRDGKLDAIEGEKDLWPVIKWKIAFLYSKETLIPYYSLDRLRIIAKHMGMGDTKKATIADIQRYLIDKREGMDIHEYAEHLDMIWREYENQAKVWMWSGDEQTFNRDRLTAGDMVSSQIRDYSQYKTKKALQIDYQKARGNSDDNIPGAYWSFIKEVQVGDIVVVFKNDSSGKSNQHIMYGWGEFTSDLINDVDSSSPLQREVEWKRILDHEITTGVVKNKLFFHGTTDKQAQEIKRLLGITKDNNNSQTNTHTMKYQAYIELLKEARNLVLTGAPGTGKTHMARQIAMEMILGHSMDYDSLTDEEKEKLKKQTDFVQFHPSYDYTDFVEGLRPIEDIDEDKNKGIKFERKDGIFKAFCKNAIPFSGDPFDKAYDKLIEDIKSNRVKTVELKRKTSAKLYVIGDNIKWYSAKEADNISSNAISRNRLKKLYSTYNTLEKLDGMSNITESIKEVIGGGDFSYYWGILHHLLQNYNLMGHFTPFVFIIDEINRGEASKIFGELFYAIDPGYRGMKNLPVKTQYQNLVPKTDDFFEGFYVPDNVYILATMNDIDRSVESMDFAMRRRFNWHEVTPDMTQDMLDELGVSLAAQAKEYMRRVNEAIKNTEGLGAAYMIGPAYFKKLGGYKGDFKKLWEMNIDPLLREYLRGFRNAEEKKKEFKDAYFNTIKVSVNQEQANEY